MGAVINADASALRGALFQVVDPHAVASADDHGGVHPEIPQGIHRGLSDGVGGKLGDIGRVKTIVGQGDGHVGLSAAEGGLHLIVLEEPVIAVWSQTQHDFAKGNHSFAHFIIPSWIDPLRCLRPCGRVARSGQSVPRGSGCP